MSTNPTSYSAHAGAPRRDQPMWWVLAPMLALGAIGAVVGLILGLVTHAPTAPFAALEVGIPAMVLGAVVGLLGLGIRALLTRRR